MRTTLDIDRDLLEAATEALGARTFTQAIEQALREALDREETRRGWSELIASDLSWGSTEELLRYRSRQGGRPL